MMRGAALESIQVSEFKAKCLALVERVAQSGEGLIVTKNGRPVAELRPYRGGRADSPFGLHRDTKIVGDIVSPLNEDWNVLV